MKVTISAADATQWHAGDEAHLFVAHQHFPGTAGQVRYLAYNAAIPVTGQTTLTFKNVIVASASTLSLYDNSTRGGLDVHLGQWPRKKAGDPLQPYGEVLPKNCVFSALGAKVTCF